MSRMLFPLSSLVGLFCSKLTTFLSLLFTSLARSWNSLLNLVNHLIEYTIYSRNCFPTARNVGILSDRGAPLEASTKCRAQLGPPPKFDAMRMSGTRQCMVSLLSLASLTATHRGIHHDVGCPSCLCPRPLSCDLVHFTRRSTGQAIQEHIAFASPITFG